MMELTDITAFFGWCTLINIGFYSFSALCIFGFKGFTTNLHSKFTGVDPNDLPALYFKFLGTFKIVIIVFNLAPYLALILMNQ